jgi:ParB family chromosome partitioning protein
MNQFPIYLLKPHPKNTDYYDDLPDEKYQEVKRSIEAHGIRDPLKITPDYTIIAGHQRLRIAKELGIEKVPVVILDVSPEEAEYLLIADNEERRQGDSDNPMKKAKRAEFLKRYWGVKHGGDRKSRGQNVLLKTLSNVAEAIGEDERTTKRLLKLNDLIPALQVLVASKKLTQTAAHTLAFLPPEEQEHLLKTLGESGICGLSVKEAQELRRQVEVALKERDELANKLAEVQEQERDLERQIASIRRQAEDLEAEVAERVGRRYEEKMRAELAGLEWQLTALKSEKEEAQRLAASLKAKIKELENAPPKVVEKIPERIQKKLAELDKIKNERDLYRDTLQKIRDEEEKIRNGYTGQKKALELDSISVISKINAFLKDMAHLSYTARQLINCDITIQNDYYNAIESLKSWCNNMLATLPRADTKNIHNGVIIDVDVN